MTELAMGTTTLLAQGDPSPEGNGTGAEFGKSAPIGLVVVLLLLVGLILLIRSMNRHVRGMPATFDEPTPTATTTRGEDDRDRDA